MSSDPNAPRSRRPATGEIYDQEELERQLRQGEEGTSTGAPEEVADLARTALYWKHEAEQMKQEAGVVNDALFILDLCQAPAAIADLREVAELNAQGERAADMEVERLQREGLPAEAIFLLKKMATAVGATPREYLEALLHYAGSIYMRPGSWEACIPFEFKNYDPRSDQAFADRWF